MTPAGPDDALDDVALLRRYAVEGAEDAFRVLVERHLGLVYEAALRQLQGAEHRAQDVAQSVFVDLARNAAALARRQEILGWLYTSTHYAAAKLKRTEQRRAQREQEAHAMHELDSPSPAPDWDRLRPVLDDALLALPEADRAVILLRFFQQRRFADLGRQLGLSENTARMRLERALEKLRAALGQRGITSTAAGLGLALASQPAVALPASLAATVAGAALAGAGGGTIAAATFFTNIMNTKTTLTAAAAALALGFGAYEFSQRRAAEAERTAAQAELAALGRERDQLRARLGAEEQRAAETAQKNAGLQQDLEIARARLAATAAAVPPAGNLNPPPANPSSPTAGRMTFRATPANMSPAEARAQARERSLDSQEEAYRALYRRLGFTPEQEAQFRRTMGDLYDRRREQMDVAMSQNPTLDRAGRESLLKAIAQQADEEWQAALRNTLGDATVQALRHHRETMPAREVTRELAGLLFDTAAPLTLPQAEQLVEIVAANSRNAQNGIDLAAMNQEAIVAQAQAFLSPPQLVALRRAQFLAQQRWNLAAAANR